MFNFIIRCFIKNPNDIQNPTVRQAYGTFAGIFGIVTNIILFVLKMIVGFTSGSISILADAINNLADSGSSILTIVGFKLSSKPADEDHPYGHARMEYLSGLGISVLIIIIGFELLINSTEKIFNPDMPNFGIITFAILIVSILGKVFQGLFYRKIGRLIKSDTLTAACTDSFNDVISTAAVLASTVISYCFNIVIDGFVGMAVSFFILYSGIKLVIETANPLIGTAPDNELIESISEKIKNYDIVLGIHDLVIHSYGAEKCFASVHVEVDANGNITDVHDMIDIIERDFLKDCGINLVIHMDPIITDSPQLTAAKEKVAAALLDISEKITMHDFRAVFGNDHTNLIFDVCVPFSFKIGEDDLKYMISEAVKKINSNWYAVVTVDRNYTGINK